MQVVPLVGIPTCGSEDLTHEDDSNSPPKNNAACVSTTRAGTGALFDEMQGNIEIEEIFGEAELSRNAMENSLSHLGHNSDGAVVFTCSDLRSAGLKRIDLIACYPFLQRVSLDNNDLTSLHPLRHLRSLVYLSARNNQLTESVFEDISGNPFALERLHLDGNELTSLDGLHLLPYLIDLTAENNRIHQLTEASFKGLSFLMRLRLAHNNIRHIEPDTFADASNIRFLDLSHNAFSDVHFASYLIENLDTLLLSDNKIAHLGAGLSDCRALVSLDLSNNDITSLEELNALVTVTSLRILILQGNRGMDTFSKTATEAQIAATSAELAEGALSLSRSEIVMDDMGKQRAEDKGGEGEEEEAAATSTSPVSMSKGRYNSAAAVSRTEPSKLSAVMLSADYAALSSAQTRGLIRHVTTAAQVLEIPWDVDRTAELHVLPLQRQSFYWLLHLFPHLTELNGVAVQPEYLARAAYFFKETKHEDDH